MKIINRVPDTFWGLKPSYLSTDKLRLVGTYTQTISIFIKSLFSKMEMTGLKEVGNIEKQTKPIH